MKAKNMPKKWQVNPLRKDGALTCILTPTLSKMNPVRDVSLNGMNIIFLSSPP
jgi:hypothetical protein